MTISNIVSTLIKLERSKKKYKVVLNFDKGNVEINIKPSLTKNSLD